MTLDLGLVATRLKLTLFENNMIVSESSLVNLKFNELRCVSDLTFLDFYWPLEHCPTGLFISFCIPEFYPFEVYFFFVPSFFPIEVFSFLLLIFFKSISLGNEKLSGSVLHTIGEVLLVEVIIINGLKIISLRVSTTQCLHSQ